jgi:hypothetical protein
VWKPLWASSQQSCVSTFQFRPWCTRISCGINNPPQPLRDRPVAARHQDLIQYALPHYPDTPDSHRAYQAQVIAWHTANPHSKPDKHHPYPLTPGMPPVGSRECWDCEQQDHRQHTPVCAGTILREPEHDWCCIASFITSTFNKEHLDAPSHTVNYVRYTQYTPYPNYVQYQTNTYDCEVDNSQGNGQELSA